MRPVVVTVAGSPGVGKTHFGLTFPDKITVMDFDGGVQDIVGKPAFTGKDIEVVDYRLPIQWKTRKKTYGTKEWTSFLEAYEFALTNSNSVLIDTGTTLWAVDRAGYQEEIGGKELIPVLYAIPNARMQAVVGMAREAGVNLILTHHIRDVYRNDKPTGDKEPDGYSHMSDLVDWAILMQLQVLKSPVRQDRDGHKIGGEVAVTTVSYIAKCRFDRALVGQEFDDLDYDMLATLVDGVEGVESAPVVVSTGKKKSKR